MGQGHGHVIGRRGIEDHFSSGLFALALEHQSALLAHEHHSVLAEFFGHESVWGRLALVPVNQGENPTARATGGDALEPPHSRLTEARRKICHHQEVIFLRRAARLGIVFRDGRILIAKVHLDDFFDVLVQLR